MRSAYQVLGVPANASPEDIEQAFQRARAFFTPERLASEDGAVDRFNEAQTAWRVLRDPQQRAAHDRKLAQPRPRAAAAIPVAVAEPPSPMARLLRIGAFLAVALFVAGGVLSWQNAERRKEAAAAEKAAAQLRAREAEEQRLQAEKAEQERRQAAAKAEAEERRIAAESRSWGAQQAYATARAEAAAVAANRSAAADALRREQLQAAEERRRELDAQRAIAADKQRIRELCWKNYGRPDC